MNNNISREPIIFQVIDWIQYHEDEKDENEESDELEKELEIFNTNTNTYTNTNTNTNTNFNNLELPAITLNSYSLLINLDDYLSDSDNISE